MRVDMAIYNAVYAVGLYVEPNAAKKALDGKVTAGTAAPEQAVFDGEFDLLHEQFHLDRMCLHSMCITFAHTHSFLSHALQTLS